MNLEGWQGVRPGALPPQASRAYPSAMLLMDRENLLAPGWSHVLSSTNDIAELDGLRRRVGAPLQALQLRPGAKPHLDLKLVPRELALLDSEVRVFGSTKLLLKAWRAFQSNGIDGSVESTR